MEKESRTIIIFLATHVKFNPPHNPIYVPLHVGREGKEDLGYIGDNVGQNISELNYLFGELTGLYWIWKNIHDIDYVGLCHYRRHFINEDKHLLQRHEYLQLLSEYDVLVPACGQCEGSYYEHYSRAHDSKPLDAVGRAVRKLYPEYMPAFEKAMSGKIFYSGNLMVTSLPILKAYAEWLFCIFGEAAEEIDVTGFDDYHKRVYGFLSEQMLYIYMLTNHLTYREVKVGISEEKAETRELKEKLQTMLAAGDRKAAKNLFFQRLEERPDLLLEGSDVYGELHKIYEELRN